MISIINCAAVSAAFLLVLKICEGQAFKFRVYVNLLAGHYDGVNHGAG
jgi:hypothetical protein